MKYATVSCQKQKITSTLFEEQENEPEGINVLLTELVDENTDIQVIWDTNNGNIVDILLNEQSIGYFATKIFCKLYNLNQAPLVCYGCKPASDALVVPLFGAREEEIC